MAKIDRVKEEIGRLKLHFGLLAASYLSLLIWIVQDTSAYVGLMERLLEAFSWRGPLLLRFFATAPILSLTAMVVVVDLVIRRKIRELEDC